MSPNSYIILSVLTHFINKQGKQWHVVLRLYKVTSKYSGENIAVVIIILFLEYKVLG